MHELYLAETILQTTRQSLPESVDPQIVRYIKVKVGALDAVVNDNLIFLFEIVRDSYNMNNAELIIEREEVRLFCNACKKELQIDEPLFICTYCGSNDVEVIAGRGMAILEAIVDDGA